MANLEEARAELHAELICDRHAAAGQTLCGERSLSRRAAAGDLPAPAFAPSLSDPAAGRPLETRPLRHAHCRAFN